MKVNKRFSKVSCGANIHVLLFGLVVFSLPQDIEVLFEAYGIKVSSEQGSVSVFRLREFVIVSPFHLLNKKLHFFLSQLPLLRALVDRLLQEGIDELHQVVGSGGKTKEKSETHTSNVITEFTVCKVSCSPRCLHTCSAFSSFNNLQTISVISFPTVVNSLCPLCYGTKDLKFPK